MPFKENASFLRFVTMGALGTRHAMSALTGTRHRPVELERYCCSNKIWQTKIKRLRVPDLLCLNCGQRFEVRAKSDLEIKMSHSRSNPDRHWDSGMRDTDLVLIVRSPPGAVPTISQTVNAFAVADLRASEATARLGNPKSASEGAEIDLTWPSWVPSSSGAVTSVDGARIKVAYDDGRKYTYRLNGKNTYIRPGDRFAGEEQVIAGTVAKLGSLQCNGSTWQPQITPELSSGELFTVLKGLTHRPDTDQSHGLTQLLRHDDPRIALEAAAALARLEASGGLDYLNSRLQQQDENAPWAMEAAFILAELGTPASSELLRQGIRNCPHPEARSACLWGLRGSVENLDMTIRAFEDTDESVVIHAVGVAASQVRGADSTARLIKEFANNDRRAAAASDSLAHAPGADVGALLTVAADSSTPAEWAYAALSRMKPQAVRSDAGWSSAPANLKFALERTWFWPSRSWLAAPDVEDAVNSLRLQNL